MAITKLLRLKEATRGSPSAHLKHNIEYICNPDKCGGGIWIGGNAGATSGIIYQTMMENKRYWGKTDGSQGFHYVISFPPELNVTQEMAYKIADDFAGELLGGNYYYAYAVHNDQHHMHVHITFDSVSKADGYKFHSPKGDWEKRIQPITDRICKKYGLPALSFTEERKGKSYGQWKSDRTNKGARERTDATWYDLIRDDVDAAIRDSDSFEDVLSHLRENGYEVELGKYLSLRPYGKERAVRSSRLGEGYSIDEIRERLKSKDIMKEEGFILYGDASKIILALKARHQETRPWKMTLFQRRYYARWRNSFLRNKPGRRLAYLSNADAVRIRRLSDAVKYMIDEDINDFPGLEKKWEELKEKKAALKAEKDALQTKLYKRRPFKELTRYEKLLRQEVKDPSPNISKEMASLRLRIEKVMDIEKAREERGGIQEKIAAIRQREKELAGEENLLEDLYTFYFEMPLPKGRAKNVPGRDEARTHGTSEKPTDGTRRWEKSRSRITVHKSLILSEEEDEYRIKIPGKDRCIHIPKSDCLLYKSGEALSAFLYDDEDYKTADINGAASGMEKGSSVKGSFDQKKDRRQMKGR